MKFLLDAHLPPALCRAFEAAGHEATTTMRLPDGNASTDQQIVASSQSQGWIVVTKDKDFYYSHVLHRTPQKLLLVRCGNLKLRRLVSLFERQLPDIERAFLQRDFVELFSDDQSPPSAESHW